MKAIIGLVFAFWATQMISGEMDSNVMWGSGTCDCFGYVGNGAVQYLVTENIVDVNANCSDSNKCISECYNYLSTSTDDGNLCFYSDYYSMTMGSLMCAEVDENLTSSPIVEYASLCDGPYLLTGFQFSGNLECVNDVYTGSCPS